MKKTNFLEQYLDLPDKTGIRYGIFVSMLLPNILNFGILSLTNMDKSLSLPSYKLIPFLIVVGIFNVSSLTVIIFAEKLAKYFFLLFATSFTGSSIFYLVVANWFMFVDFGFSSIVFSMISVLIYISVIVGVVANIRTKIHAKHSVIINSKNTSAIAIIGAVIGVFIPKPSFSETHLPLVAALLVLSYLSVFTISGFHKFYLIYKRDKLSKKEDHTH